MMNCSAKLSDFLITLFIHCPHHQPPHRTIIFDAALDTTSHSRDTLNGLYILHAYVVQRHILVTGPLLATIFTFSFSTYFSRSIIVRRCVLTASNKRILYCIVLYCIVLYHLCRSDLAEAAAAADAAVSRWYL